MLLVLSFWSNVWIIIGCLVRGKVVVSIGESLEDINYINWSDDVLSGKKRVLICGCGS